jgi:RNA polymerase sigma factor (sigma-70 family)
LFNSLLGIGARLVYEKYKQELLALAQSLFNNSAAAEDVVHDVFMAFLQLRRFRLTGSLKGYLATCVANAARNLLRAVPCARAREASGSAVVRYRFPVGSEQSCAGPFRARSPPG